MPEFPRKVLGLLLILAAVGVASWQALAVSCSSPAAAAETTRHAVPPR
ncbi:hypothetical protein [Thiocapsa marina]|uniref:Uncharacterized protein n=1 Tax=Thiocapsa marina 5811 TaxID=768671 RepID=F9U525_9GAMM|nr:hypothetical protein [Thiocapsa marina]EGV20248.1 hypothetical protein ThimaDRAFT_0026 [Thiocapsa marina 5811]